MRFSRQDSSLLIRLVSGDEPFLMVEDSNMQESFRRANRSGVWQVLDILAYTPDSTAVVVDMTKLFMDHTDYTSPFAAFAGNSMGGFSERVQRLQPGKTKLRGIKASGRSVMVTGDYHYLVDHKYMGKQVFRKDVPVNVVADRILMLLPVECASCPKVRENSMILPSNGCTPLCLKPGLPKRKCRCWKPWSGKKKKPVPITGTDVFTA